MKIVCPHTVGKKSMLCIDGHINGSRCPHYQRRGEVVNIQRMIDVPVAISSGLCAHAANIMRDYSTIGQYMWTCMEWPGVNDGKVVCSLVDNEGHIHTIQQVMDRYNSEVPTEVINDDGEGEEPQQCAAYLYH